ncbi:680875d3-d2be-4550-8ca9-1f074c87d50a [Sclerotinia trifoliorum]|uniref:680875d3-d2be-4550-8ca9-1f074c87d50a n=1 Tax=Sclerotinia trifoliorum TaxID=28548 RepID=A0A8H2VS42_9HELO|nr:680875d3-d2be-4550-8ca9-1f074c87d50a [Sclerotinia trifoliorum]
MAAKQLPAVLRITSSATNQDEVFLLLVESAGSRPLDVKLIGTDGELVFAVSLKHSKISTLKAKNSPYTDEEWSLVLSSILLHEPPKEEEGNVTRGVEIHAKVEKKAMTLVIQKVIEGIRQRLGTIKLDETEEEEISLFDWCALATKSADSSKDELEALRIKYSEQQETLKKLNENFRELTKRKSDHENQLLGKFSLMFNEKKLKVRDQQRLLAGAKVDPDKVEAVQNIRSGKSRTAGASRSGKRKAAKEVQPGSSDSDDAFEKMDVDQSQDENDIADESDQPKIQTPDQSDEETDTEDEQAPHPESHQSVSKYVVQDKSDEEMQTAPRPTETTKIAELPAKRELPFEKKSAPVPASKPANDGSETESGSDDEL